MGRAARRRTTLCLLFAVLEVAQLGAEEAAAGGPGCVVLTLLSAPLDNGIAGQVAAAITRSLELDLRMTGDVTVERADFLVPGFDLTRTLGYYSKVSANLAVFGSVDADPSGGYIIEVRIWNADRSNDPPTVVRRQVTEVLSIFDVADSVGLQVASQILGRNLELGRLVIKGSEQLPDFAVYADGHLLGRNESSFQIVTGERQIIIAKPGPLGDQPIQMFTVAVQAGKTTQVALEQTSAAPKRPAPEPSQGSEALAPPKGARTGAEGAGALTGRLSVQSDPPGAAVFLDRTFLGATPLDLFGVPVGKYNLRAERTYFRPVNTVAEIRPGERTTSEVTLEVDQSDPAVRSRLLSPATASIASAGWSLVQGAYVDATFLLSNGNFGYFGAGLGTDSFSLPASVSYLADALFFRIGHLYAGDTAGSIVLGIGGTALAAASLGVRATLANAQQSGAAYNAPLNAAYWMLTAGGAATSILYDLVFAPAAVERSNRRLLEYVRKHGEPPAAPAPPAGGFLIETGGGSLARVGYRFPVIRDYLSCETTVGMSAVAFQPFRPAATGSIRAVLNPFGPLTGSIRPALFVSAGSETDLAQWGVFAGAGIGADYLFKPVGLFTRSEYRFGFMNGLSYGTFTLGMRL